MATTRANADAATMKAEPEPLVSLDPEESLSGASYPVHVLEGALDVMVKRAYPGHSLVHAAANVKMMALHPDIAEAIERSIKRVTV